MLVGDSLGLPAEGLTPRRIQELRWHQPWKQRLFFGHGFGSDDTDHALFTARAARHSGGDPERFRKLLARELKCWFLAFPPATGLATAKACFKLMFGVSPNRSGVFSAGNGPAMRSPVLGAIFAEEPEKRRAFVEISTRMTHSDPRALAGALAAAEAVACGELDAAGILQRVREITGEDWREIWAQVEAGLAKQMPVAELARIWKLENGVTGYMLHTVPIAIYGWLRHRRDFAAGLSAVLDLGGDTDSVGAIYAALASTGLNEDNQIPLEWRRPVYLTPRGYLPRLKRNAFLFVLVLWHGLVLRPLPAAITRRLVS